MDLSVRLTFIWNQNMTDVTDMNDGPEIAELKLHLDAWHNALGGRMVSFAGYSMPVQYEGVMAEHLWTRENAGLFDVSHMGQLIFRSEDLDVGAALETLLPGNIKGLGVDRLRYSLLLADDGGILDDLMVTRRKDDFYMVVNGAVKHDDMAHILDVMPDNVTLNYMEDHALLALQGPKAGDVMKHLVPETDMLYFMQAGEFDWDGVSLWISRSGYTGEDGFEISVHNDDAQKLADALIAHQAVKPIGLGARDSLRLEAGLPLYGHDLNADILPFAASLGFAVPKRRREEGGFLGSDAVIAQYNNQPENIRIGIRVEGRQPVREGALILDPDGIQVGIITSGGFSPTLQYPISMGYVPVAMSIEGTKLTLQQRGKEISGTVTAMPFVPSGYRRAPK